MKHKRIPVAAIREAWIAGTKAVREILGKPKTFAWLTPERAWDEEAEANIAGIRAVVAVLRKAKVL